MEKKESMKPMTVAELLPSLRGIMSKEVFERYTKQNNHRATILPTRSNERTYKPLTMAELSCVMQGLNSQSSRKPEETLTAKKKKWNTSVKVEHKKRSHTANGQMRHNPVRKVLNMASNTEIPSTTRIPLNSETPKFPKPEYKAKKPFSLHGRNNVRISGIFAIPDTSLDKGQIKITGQTMVNKENIIQVQTKDYIINTPASSEVIAHKKLITPTCHTTQLKETWISSCDDSFLQREKEIQDFEEKTNVICKEQTLENTDEIQPPMSTPFKNFRCAKDFFNDTAEMNLSALCDNDTIMSFDEPSQKQNKREETVIVALCDLVNKVNLTNPKIGRSELNDLVEFQKQSEIKIKMIEQSIKNLNKIKLTEIKILETVTRLIEEKSYKSAQIDNTDNINNTISDIRKKPCPVIKVTSPKNPTYKIPKKNSSLRKSVISKTMLHVPNLPLSPHKDMNEKALNIYMNMKKHVTFLKTPVKSEGKIVVHGTPSATVTSLNLQKQLDKLYCE